MEIFNPNKLESLAFEAINQRGGDIDRYIYQEGAGLASLLGNLFRKSIPLLGKAIKVAVHIAKPYAKAAATELANTAINELPKNLKKLFIENIRKQNSYDKIYQQ